MKKSMLNGLLIACLFWLPVSGQTKEMFDQVLTRLDCENCFYIPLRVESVKFAGQVIVENDDLRRYLIDSRIVNKGNYKDFMLTLLSENGVLRIGEVELDEEKLFLRGKNIRNFTFRVVERSNNFDHIASQGCAFLIDSYFAPRVLWDNENDDCRKQIKTNAADLFVNPTTPISEQNNLILALFKLNIPIYKDDLSGSLKVGHLTLK